MRLCFLSKVASWYVFKPKIQILGGLGMKKVGVFWGHLEYVKAIRYILWLFGILVEVWYIFPRFCFLK
jgi:hypothetical protein